MAWDMVSRGKPKLKDREACSFDESRGSYTQRGSWFMSDHSGPEISMILADDARVSIQWRSSFGSRDSSSRFGGNVSEPLDSSLEGFSCNSRRA